MDKLDEFMKRGCDILGSRYALLGGAMTWISNSTLVAAMSNAGIFGVLASGAMSSEELSIEIQNTMIKTDKFFGVNIIMAHPKLHDLIDVCAQQKVSHIILAGGFPDKSIIEKIHNYGMRVIGFAPTLALAKRLFKNGIDALILEGCEAGGHVGHVSTLVLVQDILLNMPGYPIFVAGGLIRGEVIAQMMRLGAYGCQLGTVFACAKESPAHANFKKAFFNASGRNAVTPVQLDKKFPVTPVRALENVATEEFIKRQREVIIKFYNNEVTLEEGRLMLEHFWAGALRRAVQNGDVERGSLMSGQIVELVKSERSVQEIIDEILSQMRVTFDI